MLNPALLLGIYWLVFTKFINQAIPSFEESAGTFAVVGAAETRSYTDALCNEIEDAIRSRGYWIGELPADT